MINFETFPKPYTCKLSLRHVGVDIIYEDAPIFTVQLTLNKIHQNIVAALNGAYLEGYLLKERELDVQ